MQATIVNVMADGFDHFAYRAAPIALARPAIEIGAFIVDQGTHLVSVAAAMKCDVEEEITESASEPQ